MNLGTAALLREILALLGVVDDPRLPGPPPPESVRPVGIPPTPTLVLGPDDSLALRPDPWGRTKLERPPADRPGRPEPGSEC